MAIYMIISSIIVSCILSAIFTYKILVIVKCMYRTNKLDKISEQVIFSCDKLRDSVISEMEYEMCEWACCNELMFVAKENGIQVSKEEAMTIVSNSINKIIFNSKS